ncbi:hypothetical protein OIU84_027550 [Salix udensis]|uniref:Uncharacterized protein n=1 Tax=Salix udensis TaxID=889485 RepID=A0AAD6KFR2_9ROSI|nr:hypothetical protein OIU84_027550 [Salix udensis]
MAMCGPSMHRELHHQIIVEPIVISSTCNKWSASMASVAHPRHSFIPWSASRERAENARRGSPHYSEKGVEGDPRKWGQIICLQPWLHAWEEAWASKELRTVPSRGCFIAGILISLFGLRAQRGPLDGAALLERPGLFVWVWWALALGLLGSAAFKPAGPPVLIALWASLRGL